MSAFELPATRPVRITEITQVVSSEGELLQWEGLNTDLDRCPTEFCDGNCSKRCRCAPCRCPECLLRESIARGELEPAAPRRRRA